VISGAGFLCLRDLVKQSDILKSKHEECEAYVVEIEVWTIFHLYLPTMFIDVIFSGLKMLFSMTEHWPCL
jgi:hypothetical protein